MVSAYPNQPPGGWPQQPPSYTGRPDYAGSTGAPEYQRAVRRRRRRGRGWIALLIILVLLAVAFVIGDQVTRSYAQNMIAAKFQSEGLPVKPDVSIKGWPFLTQVAERDVGTIDISASNFREDQIDIASFNATASGVHINSSYNGATIDSITGTILVTYSSVASAAGISGATITPDPAAGPDVAKVSDGPLSTTAKVSQTGPYQLTFQLQAIQGLPISVPSYTLNLPHFPSGIEVSGVAVTAQGLQIAVTAHDTTLSQ